MKKYLFKSKFLFFFNLLLPMAYSIIEIYLAFLFGDIVDISVSGDMLKFKRVVYIYIGLITIQIIVSYLIKIFRRLFIKSSMSSLKEDIFDSILSKDTYAFNSTNSADYISIINNDTNLIEKDYFTNVLDSFQYISLFVLGTYSIFKLNIYIAITVFIIGFIPILIPMIFQKEMGIRKQKYSNSLSSFTIKVKDMFSGFDIIKSFDIEEKIKDDFQQSNNNVEIQKYNSGKMEATINSISEFFGEMMFFVPMTLGIYLTLQGKFTTGGMLASIQLMNYIVSPIRNY